MLTIGIYASFAAALLMLGVILGRRAERKDAAKRPQRTTEGERITWGLSSFVARARAAGDVRTEPRIAAMAACPKTEWGSIAVVMNTEDIDA